MTVPTANSTVTFKRPFVIGGFDEELAAGVYIVETEESLLQGISFPAYRRISTLIHVHAKPGRSAVTQTVTIDPNELDAALARDRASKVIPVGPDVGP